jgi:hypothetical protein
MQTITTTALFGSHRKGVSSKNDKPYNFMEISNGFAPITYSTDLDISATEALSQGDKVEVEIEIDPFNGRNSKIVSISSTTK